MDSLRTNANTKTYFETNLSDAKPAPNFAPLFPEAAEASEGGTFHHKGLDVPFFVSRAENERAVVVACTGLNSYTALRAEELKQMNDAGVSVIWMALPPHKSNSPFMPHFITAGEGFFTDPESPANKLFDSKLPRYAFTHSTGGQIFTALEQNPETNARILERYKEVTHIAPYFDATNVSLKHSLAPIRWVFDKYAHMNADRKPHETFFGKVYLAFKAATEPFTKTGQDISPTYGQILEVQHWGRTLISAFSEAAEKKGITIPATFVVGRDDPFASALTSIDLARQTDAALEIVPKGGHYPINEKIVAKFLERVGLAESLSDSPRVAAQSRTGLLDTTARLFQGLGRRGVGNAEVGREAESHALHGSHALGLQ